MNKKYLNLINATLVGLFMMGGMVHAAQEMREGEMRHEIIRSELTPEEETLSQREFGSEEVREISDINMLNRLYPVSQMAATIGNGAIELADGSIWQVSPYDAPRIKKWQPGRDLLVITQNTSWFWTPTYQFLIHNESTGTYAEANIQMAPFLDRAQQVVDVDQYGRVIRLTDGSAWGISAADDYIYYDRPGGLAQRRWVPGDQVIIGVNYETFGSIYRPFILINVTVDGKYARAEKIH
jgi:hypothetical protein